MYTTPNKANTAHNRFRLVGQVIVTVIVAIVIAKWLIPSFDPIRIIRKASEDTPKSYFELGMKSMQRQSYRAAKAYFTQAIESDPENPEIYYYRSRSSFMLDRLEDTLADLEKALALNPDYAPAYVGFGTVYQQQGKLEEALANFNHAISLQPDFVDALLYRAEIYRNDQNFDSAIQDYSKIVESFSEDTPPVMLYNVHVNRAWVYMANNMVSEGITDYEIAYTAIPQNAHIIRAVLNQFQSQIDEIDPDSQAFLKFSEFMEKLEAQ